MTDLETYNRLWGKPDPQPPWWVMWMALGAILIGSLFFAMKAHAQEPVDIERLATAIYYAEGGARTSHPYGILAHYKNTTPRQACINTIRHAVRDWNGNGDFISFLGKRYCPVGATNDPRGLNRNWIKNVRYFYTKQERR